MRVTLRNDEAIRDYGSWERLQSPSRKAPHYVEEFVGEEQGVCLEQELTGFEEQERGRMVYAAKQAAGVGLLEEQESIE